MDGVCYRDARRRREFLASAGAVGIALLAPALRAQGAYPTKTIKIIAPGCTGAMILMVLVG